MFKTLGLMFAVLISSVAIGATPPEIPFNKFNMIAPVEPKGIDPEMFDVQVPIAKENRAFNVSGVQCVWCSLQNLAKHHKETRLYDLTDKYKHATGPAYVGRVLDSRGVKYKQVYSGKQAGVNFIKEYVTKKKLGVGVGVNNIHMINVVHFDETKGVVKVIDNGGPNALKIQTWTVDQFTQRFDGWAVVIFPPNYRETFFDRRWGKRDIDYHPLDRITLLYYDEN
jgi:hypothetical protein